MTLDGIILAAGPGSRMVELTRGRPKCLLPVGNHCLIWYAVSGLRSIGVSRIIILVPDIYEQDVKQYCHKKFNSIKGLTIEFVNVSVKADCGTAESILEIRDKIKRDFIVYSCDSIIHPKALSKLLNHYRLYDPMLAMLFSDNINFFQEKNIPGRREKDHYSRDVIAYEPLERIETTECDGSAAIRVVFTHSERDIGKKLKIKSCLLALHPSLRVCSRFLDTHVYIFKKQVLDTMAQHKDKAVLKSEMIPFLISKQFSKPDIKFEDDDVEMEGKFNSSDYESELRDRLELFKPRNIIESDYLRKPRLSSPTACHAVVCTELLATRVNTLGSYLDANRDAKNIINIFNMKSVATIKDCIIGEDVKLGEKCVLKAGSIGNTCRIGDKCKIIGCVVMDNVEIESGVLLSDCIIGSNSKISSKCDLKSCIVGYKQMISGGKKTNSELIIDDGYIIDLSNPMDNDTTLD